MSDKDSKKTAICGVSGNEIFVSSYNFNCPCLNCLGCHNEDTQCQWKYVLETNPCADDDIRAVVCKNCVKVPKEQQR